MRRIAIITIAGILAVLTCTMFIPQVFSIPLFAPVVITFDSSNQAVKTSTNTILDLYPTAKVIKYEDAGSLWNVLTMMRSYSQLILIGHGSDKGILSSQGTIIPWKNITDWVNTQPSTDVYFLSCNSNTASKLVHKPSLGFVGNVDGPLAAYAIAMKDNLNHNQAINSKNALTDFVNRYTALYKGGHSENMSVVCMCSTGGTTTPPPQPKNNKCLGRFLYASTK